MLNYKFEIYPLKEGNIGKMAIDMSSLKTWLRTVILLNQFMRQD
ncbi:hypothetical protein ACDX78_17255 [Virgibacillus oceani]